MAYVLGLTGSIGMGKTTTARMFADLGIPVWDADAVVHRLYATGGAAAFAIGALYPEVMEDGAVSRPKLRSRIAADPGFLDVLQSHVHPLVAEDRKQFLRDATAKIVVLDVPLLFESGIDALCDGIIVVTAPAPVQRARVLARGEMSDQDFDALLSRQMPDAEKRRLATWVVETTDMDSARRDVARIVAMVTKGLPDA